MYLAWRDLLFARGRFALIAGVVALITLLVTLLSGLTQGLGRESTSAITGLPADRVVFSHEGDAKPSYAASALSSAQVTAWERAEQGEVMPMGISTTRMTTPDGVATVTVLGVEAGSGLVPPTGSTRPDVAAGTAVLSATAAEELKARVGSTVAYGGQELTVGAIGRDDSLSHTPVVWVPLASWQQMSHQQASVLALRGVPSAEVAKLDGSAGTSTLERQASLQALDSYRSENGSLQAMRGMLFAISALVVGAFFTVWTVQRAGDVAVLKAIGTSTRWLLRDSLAQALLLLLIGVGAGTAVATGLGFLARDRVPFVLDLQTLLLPGAAMLLLGLLGAALPIVRVTRVDPLTALGSAR